MSKRRAAFLFLSSLSLAGCVGNSAHFESGLRDPTIGKPVLEQREPAPVTTARAATPLADDEQLRDYRLDNIKPQQRPSPASEEGGIWLEVERHEEAIRQASNRITDPKLNSYIQGLICKIAGEHCSQVRVYVLRIPIFNASMSPNGMMHVYSGFLLRVRNEAELVSVLGHEFGHFLRRHSLQRMQDAHAKMNALAFARIALVMAGLPPGVNDLMQLSAIASIQAYSRDHEREADGYGLRAVFDNGYDMHSAGRIWERVTRESELADSPRGHDPILGSHPSDGERQDELKRIADLLEPRASGKQLGRERFLEHVLPFRASFIEDEISRHPQKRAHALLDMLIEDGVRLGELHYFKGEIFRRSAAEDGPKDALREYEKAIQNDGFPLRTHRSKALALMSLGRKDEARQSFEEYLKADPKASDAPLVRMQIEELK